MSKEELFKHFTDLFPFWAEPVTKYKKIGSKCIAVYYPDGSSYVFLYIDNSNWQFGTKLWRKKPDKISVKGDEKDA